MVIKDFSNKDSIRSPNTEHVPLGRAGTRLRVGTYSGFINLTIKFIDVTKKVSRSGHAGFNIVEPVSFCLKQINVECMSKQR